jgi:hypothetical protein
MKRDEKHSSSGIETAASLFLLKENKQNQINGSAPI